MTILATLGSDGDLELFRPVNDDDHVDLVVALKGKPPKLALQVKTAMGRDQAGRVHANVNASVNPHREDAAFYYVVLWIDGLEAKAVWLVPSADFDRLAYHLANGELLFMAYPDGDVRFDSFRVAPSELGRGLMSKIDSLPPGFRLSVPLDPESAGGRLVERPKS